jgi:hypothetical protein
MYGRKYIETGETINNRKKFDVKSTKGRKFIIKGKKNIREIKAVCERTECRRGRKKNIMIMMMMLVVVVIIMIMTKIVKINNIKKCRRILTRKSGRRKLNRV